MNDFFLTLTRYSLDNISHILFMLFLHYRNDIADFIATKFGIDLLPKELYHLDAIPATISWFDISMVLLTVWVMCTVAALIPAYIAASKDPSTALRYE